jgi:lipopolysaccharide transport system permease protein
MAQIFKLANPTWYAPAIRSTCNILYKHRVLLWEMSKLELRDRYVGQVLGIFWAIIMPILTMAVYLFIFVFVFNAKMPDAQEYASAGWGGSYALYLLSGLLPWMALQDIMGRSVTTVSGNARLVKQVVFPLEVLPLKIFYASFLSFAIPLALFFIYGIVMHGLPSPLALCLPLVVLTQYLMATGIAFIFSAIGVYLRDLKDIVGVICFVLIYTMPIFFVPSMLPEKMYTLILLNPFSHMIQVYHDVLFYGQITESFSWVFFPMFAIALFFMGCRVFYSTKHSFGNML